MKWNEIRGESGSESEKEKKRKEERGSEWEGTIDEVEKLVGIKEKRTFSLLFFPRCKLCLSIHSFFPSFVLFALSSSLDFIQPVHEH